MELTSYFRDNWKKIMPASFDLIDCEHTMYGTLTDTFSEKCGKGRCDYIFKYYGNDFITELELGENPTEFWHSFKVLAYKNAYILDNPTVKKSKVKALVILNAIIYKPNFINILAMSDISSIFLNSDGQIYKSFI